MRRCARPPRPGPRPSIASTAPRPCGVARWPRPGPRSRTVEGALRAAEREEQPVKLRADQAEAACLDARVRLAACEEEAQAPEPPTDGHGLRAARRHRRSCRGHLRVGRGTPLVIESIVSGDRVALELAAARIAEHTGLSPAETQLQLQELLDAVLSAAAEDGFLTFDAAHPFWAGL